MIKSGRTVWTAENAVLVGDITIGEGSSVWYGAILRGDENTITIGKNTNIQDGAVLHEARDYPLVIGDGVTVGHRAILHGCEIGDNVVVGMGSIILNGAKIGRDSIVGAGALVTQNKEFPPGSMILGSPARAIRNLTPEEIEANRWNAEEYVRLNPLTGEGTARQAEV